MSTQTTTIQLRVDKKTKTKASKVFKDLGFDMSSAMKVFLSQVIRTKSIPFSIRTVNGFTPEYERMILDELKAMNNGREKSFKTVAEFMESLNRE